MSRKPASSKAAAARAAARAASDSEDRFHLTGRGRCIRIHDRINDHSAPLPRTGSVADVLRTVSVFMRTPKGEQPQYPGAPKPAEPKKQPEAAASKAAQARAAAAKIGSRKMPPWVAEYKPRFEHGDLVMARTRFEDAGLWGYEIRRGSRVIGRLIAEAEDRWVVEPSAKELAKTVHRNPVSTFLRMKNVLMSRIPAAPKAIAASKSAASVRASKGSTVTKSQVINRPSKASPGPARPRAAERNAKAPPAAKSKALARLSAGKPARKAATRQKGASKNEHAA